MAETVNVIKRGEMCVQVTLSRTSGGLHVTAKTHPSVEEFMRHLSCGQRAMVDTIARNWVQVDRPLEVYMLNTPIGGGGGTDGFRLDAPGRELIMAGDLGSATNLSFLRLIGISEGNGVTFGLKGVYSLDQLRKMRDAIAVASRRLYAEYMRPVDLSLTVSTQELQL